MADIELKPQVYKDPRPKEYFDQFHERVRNGEPEWIYELVRVITVWHAIVSFRARGLAAMSPERRREIASKGGRTSQARGTAHQWTAEEASAAGKKGSARYALRRAEIETAS